MKINEAKAVARLAEIVAPECGIPLSEAKKIRAAAALHDIGKQKIPKGILEKPGALTPEEFEIMKTHTTPGAAMLKSIQGELGEMARLTALYHHERRDGHGYWGKPAGDLPLYVPLTSIVDVFTALICEREYKHGRPPDEALAYIQNQSGAMFSPALVKVFLSPARNDARVQAIFERRC